MEAKEFDFEFPRGDTCPVSFRLTDSNGEPLTPTSSTEIYFTVKKNFSTSTAILQKRKSLGEITVNNDVCSFVLTHSDTASLNYGTYVYDIQIKENDYVKTILIGNLTLTNESTHLSNE